MACWITGNIDGIGLTIAGRLYRIENLETLVVHRDRCALINVKGMNNRRVDSLTDGWPSKSLYDTIDWLQVHQLLVDIATRIVNLFGEDTLDRVRAPPFLLMSMGMPIEQMLKLVSELGMDLHEDEVLTGVAQHAAVECLSTLRLHSGNSIGVTTRLLEDPEWSPAW
jgi:hypothetical protein